MVFLKVLMLLIFMKATRFNVSDNIAVLNIISSNVTHADFKGHDFLAWLYGCQCWSVSPPVWVTLKHLTTIEWIIHVPHRMNWNNFADSLSSSAIIKPNFLFVQCFGLWLNTCKTNFNPVSLSCTNRTS